MKSTTAACLLNKHTSIGRSFSTVHSMVQFQANQFGRKPEETIEYTRLSQETTEKTYPSSVYQSESNNKPLLTADKVAHYYLHNHTPLAAQQHLAELEVDNLVKRQPTNPKELDSYRVIHSYEPKDMTDKVALTIMKILRVFVHGFFGNRYLHHSVVLETVAAVPGMVSACWRHFTSLRGMRRDYGHIASLVEEAENERMHLLTWMELTNPTFFERVLVILAQFGFTTFYSMAYIVNPRFCHRLVGYLEEEAVNAYTMFLDAIDKGEIPNVDAPEIAIKYWNLPAGSKLRDVVLVVRADECMHRDYNHTLSSKHRAGVNVAK